MFRRKSLKSEVFPFQIRRIKHAWGQSVKSYGFSYFPGVVRLIHKTTHETPGKFGYPNDIRILYPENASFHPPFIAVDLKYLYIPAVRITMPVIDISGRKERRDAYL